MLKLDVNFSGVLEDLDGIGERAGDAVRSAAYRGALLIRDEAIRLAPKSEKPHWFYSKRRKDGKVGQKYLFQPGDLKKSVFMAFAEEASVDFERAAYAVGFKLLSTSENYVPYAHMVEFGTARQAARPFLRPAFDTRRQAAQAVMADRIWEAVWNDDN